MEYDKICHYKLEIEEDAKIWNASGFTIKTNKNLTYIYVVITFVKEREDKKVAFIFDDKYWMIKLDSNYNFIYDYLYSVPFFYENEKMLVGRIVKAINAMFDKNILISGA